MLIQIDYQDKRPIYEQIVEKIQNLIVKGVLSTNDKMPSVRMLAIELSINPNTIQKAYQELERIGYIYTIKGRGNFVSSSEKWMSNRKADYMAELDKILENLAAMGIDESEIIAHISKRGCV